LPRLRPNPLNKTQNKLTSVNKAFSDLIISRLAVLDVDTEMLSKTLGVCRKTFYDRKKRPIKLTLEQMLTMGDILKFKDEDYINILTGKELTL
jgi:urease accessory protein UreE